MKTKKIILAVLFLIYAGMAPAQDRSGRNLLDGLVAQFQQMKEKGSGGFAVVDGFLQDLMASAKSARTEKKIDPPFFKRYVRMLQVLKLAIVSADYDREGILNSLIQAEIDRFVADVSGIEPGKPGAGIALVADAVSEEIINLYMTLDCMGKRDELRRKFNGGEVGRK
ncbi:MAG TPA: hypothetical protein PK919_11035 [Candidatus Aminicenantes bacterium]|nr:hypothetical protein [Candidatus Aminicenantes bacterium]